MRKSCLDRRLLIANCQDLPYYVGLTCRLGSYIDEVPRFLKRGEVCHCRQLGKRSIPILLRRSMCSSVPSYCGGTLRCPNAEGDLTMRASMFSTIVRDSRSLDASKRHQSLGTQHYISCAPVYQRTKWPNAPETMAARRASHKAQ